MAQMKIATMIVILVMISFARASWTSLQTEPTSISGFVYGLSGFSNFYVNTGQSYEDVKNYENLKQNCNTAMCQLTETPIGSMLMWGTAVIRILFTAFLPVDAMVSYSDPIADFANIAVLLFTVVVDILLMIELYAFFKNRKVF